MKRPFASSGSCSTRFSLRLMPKTDFLLNLCSFFFKSERDSPMASGCCVCSKTAYPLERVIINDRVFHERCFKCCVCMSKLQAGTFASLNGLFYCRKDYHTILTTSGGKLDAFNKGLHLSISFSIAFKPASELRIIA